LFSLFAVILKRYRKEKLTLSLHLHTQNLSFLLCYAFILKILKLTGKLKT
jgi:hypothetical protein